MGNANTESAAAVLIATLAQFGDEWRPVTAVQLGAWRKVVSVQGGIWESFCENPFLMPNISRLVAEGWAAYCEGADITGLRPVALAQRTVDRIVECGFVAAPSSS